MGEVGRGGLVSIGSIRNSFRRGAEGGDMQEKPSRPIRKISPKNSKNTQQRGAKSPWCKQKVGGSPQSGALTARGGSDEFVELSNFPLF